MAESSITPRSHDSFNNHFEDQMLSKNHNNEIDKIAIEIAKILQYFRHVEHDHQVEDDEAIDIKAILQDKNDSHLSTKCCIYRVPHGIRKYNPEAFTPRLVSIGPLHYGNPNLQNMETHKQVFFKAFMERSHTSLDNLIAIVENSEPNIRECYSENIKLSKKELVKMIILDAGFIIELFLKTLIPNWCSSYDSTLSLPWFRNQIIWDLIMFENQLPFFILEELFNLAFPPRTCGYLPSFLELTVTYFSCFNVQELDPSTTPDFSTKHFTDLLRTFHLKQKNFMRRPFESRGSNALVYGANELQEAGVKFEVNTTNKCVLDLNFSRGVLEIPEIMVHDETESELRNMIALEQCLYPYDAYISDYALFLDCLINTTTDVDILVHRQIIGKILCNSDDVAKVFNGLGRGILITNIDADYLNICTKLNAFCEDPCNKLMATLRQDYCKTPWQIVASIAGIMLLILTLVQTIFSIIK